MRSAPTSAALTALLVLVLAACEDGDVPGLAVGEKPVHGAPLYTPRKPEPVLEELAALSADGEEGAGQESALSAESPGAATDAPAPKTAVAAPDDAPAAAKPRASHSNPGHGVKTAAHEGLAEGVAYLTFEDLSWPEYEPPEVRDIEDETLALSDFPERLQKLNGTRAALDGYMVPVDFADRRVTSFILSRYLPGCCFGVMPMMDEWIEVDVRIAGGVEYFPFQIVRAMGELEVGEVLDDYGYVRSIYRLKADKVEEQL